MSRAGLDQFQGSGLGLLSILCCGLIVPHVAIGQVQINALRYCTTLAADQQRLDCFDQAMRYDDGRVPIAASTVDQSRQSSGDDSAAPQAPAAARIPASAAERSAEASQLREAPAVQRSLEGPARAQRSRSRDAVESFPVVVVGVLSPVGRPRQFETDSGETWVQTNQSTRQFPSPPFNALIEQRTVGSFWLVGEDGRGVRVRQR